MPTYLYTYLPPYMITRILPFFPPCKTNMYSWKKPLEATIPKRPSQVPRQYGPQLKDYSTSEVWGDPFLKGKMVGVPWDGGPLIINPIYTLYSGYLLGISPFKGLLGGLKQLGYHPRVPAFFLWFFWSALPETNISPENKPSQKERFVFQPSIFRGYVRFMEVLCYSSSYIAHTISGFKTPSY